MSKKIRLSSNKMLTGTAAGVAEYFDLDPNIGRIGFAVFGILTGGVIAIVAYLAIWLILSNDK